MRKVPCVLASLALASAIATPCFAATADYSFLDDMTVSELEALRDEVEERLSDANSEEASDDQDIYGAWAIDCSQDEFGRKNGPQFIRLKEPVEGKFSNSFTTNSDCLFQIFLSPLDENDCLIQLRIAEYGTQIVKATSGSQIYDVKVLDKDDIEHEFMFVMLENDDTMGMGVTGLSEMNELLKSGGPISFLIKDVENTSYLFTIEDTSGLEDALSAISEGYSDKAND